MNRNDYEHTDGIDDLFLANASSIVRAQYKKINVNNCLIDKGTLIILSISNFNILQTLHEQSVVNYIYDSVFKLLQEHLPARGSVYKIVRGYYCLITPFVDREQLFPYIYHLMDIIKNHYCYYPQDITPIVISLYAGGANLANCGDDLLPSMTNAYTALKSAIDNKILHFEYYIKSGNLENEKREIEAAHTLQKAMLEDRLALYFQPIISAKTSKIEYYEALLRIKMENGKIEPAAYYIQSAENMRLADDLDVYVLNLVAHQLKSHPKLKVSMNVSAFSIGNHMLLPVLDKLFKYDTIFTSRLIIEITETFAHVHLSSTAEFISELHRRGIKVALDDFGAGHTSFMQLRKLNIDTLKIDGSYIKDILTNPASLAITKAMVELCKAFNISSVAEFVENKEIADLLIQIGVDYLQGYFYSPAVSESELKGID